MRGPQLLDGVIHAAGRGELANVKVKENFENKWDADVRCNTLNDVTGHLPEGATRFETKEVEIEIVEEWHDRPK